VPAPRPVVAAPTVIGVSVAIPEPWAGEIQDLRAAYGDPLARSIPTHVTLLPPTELPAEALPRIGEHLRRVAAGQSPFRMQLRGSGTFRPVSPVTYIRVDAGLRECRVLEAAVRAGPLARELAFPYHPHITVGHGLPDGVLARAERELRGYRAEFTVTAFSLYRFGADDVWRPMRAFELAAGAAY
jgi:2'-5' RNA ligase